MSSTKPISVLVDGRIFWLVYKIDACVESAVGAVVLEKPSI